MPPAPPAKSHLVVGFLGKIQTMKSVAKEDLDLPMKGKGSLSSSSPLFGILEII